MRPERSLNMSIIYDNIVAFAVALLACGYAWLYGGIVGSALLPAIPWLTLLLLEVMLCFPQRHSGESTYAARARVWRHLKSDPATWVALVFSALLMIPFVNKALCPLCDYPAIVAGASESAPVPFLPSCVNRMHHLNVVVWFVPTFVAMLAVRHSLLKRGKRTVLEMIVWNGFALAMLGFVQSVMKAEAPLWGDFEGPKAYFFSTFGYPNMGGDYFTTLFALAVGLWRWRFDAIRRDEAHARHQGTAKSGPGSFWHKHYMLIPAVLFFFAALTTLSRAAIILVTLLAIVFFMHTFVSIFVTLSKPKRAKASAVSLFAMVGIAMFAAFFTPDDLQQEVNTLGTDVVLDRVTGKGQYHTRVAFEVFKDYPLFGCGGWGYSHLCIPRMREEERLQMVGGANVHNDYLQFMAEHGAFGFGCLVALVIIILWPLGRVWRVLVDSVRFVPPKFQPAKPVAIFALPAPVFCILAAAFATFVHAFGDCPLRCPAVLSLFFIELAAMDGFLPTIRERKD